jgi:hypothetical protein
MWVVGIMELIKDDPQIQKGASDRSFLDQLAGQTTGPLTMIFRLYQGGGPFLNDAGYSEGRPTGNGENLASQ